MKNVNILLTTTVLAASLVACGGGGGNGNGGGGGGGGTPQSFDSAVRALVATSPENTDPQALGTFPTPNFPENTDPAPL